MKTQYVKKNSSGTFYYKDKGMTILHREDGPAVRWFTGDTEWWIDGIRHREDGPAMEWPDGSKEWWINGVQMTEEEFNI